MLDSSSTPLASVLEAIAALGEESPDAGTPAVAESTVVAGLMPPLHVHEADEAVRVLEGAMVLYAGEETVQLTAGESFVVPGGVSHTLRALSGRVRFLTMSLVRSAGAYEDFVRALGAPVSAGGVAPTAEDEATMRAFAAPSGIEVLGPPGTLPAAAETAA